MLGLGFALTNFGTKGGVVDTPDLSGSSAAALLAACELPSPEGDGNSPTYRSVFSYRPRDQLNFMPSGFLSFERFRISPKWFPRTRFPLAMSFVSLAAFPPVPQSQSKQIGNKFSGVSSPSSA